jgi:hypothetical protein
VATSDILYPIPTGKSSCRQRGIGNLLAGQRFVKNPDPEFR